MKNFTLITFIASITSAPIVLAYQAYGAAILLTVFAIFAITAHIKLHDPEA